MVDSTTRSATRLPLASLLTEIADEEAGPEAARKLQTLIQRQMLASPTLDTLTYADASGNVVASSAVQGSRPNIAEQEFFRFHRLSGFALAVLGRPYFDKPSQQWLIPVSQRVEQSDGSFGGVVISTVRRLPLRRQRAPLRPGDRWFISAQLGSNCHQTPDRLNA